MGYTLVTGAASDIGKSICQKLAEQGHSLLMLDIDEEEIKSSLGSLLNPEKHLVLEADLTEQEKWPSDLASLIVQTGIGVDYAVFAAGIFSVKPLRMVKYDYFIKSMQIGVWSVVQTLQILSSAKKNNGFFKSAVVISSLSAKQGVKGYSVYSLTKAALLGLTRSLATEIAPARINAILPGGIKTRATAFMCDENGLVNPRGILGEGEPKDIASLVSFLLSEDSKWITGQEFVIDGGASIN